MAVLSANSTAVSRSRGPCRSQKLKSGVADIYYQNGVVAYLAAGLITPVVAATLEFAGLVREASDGQCAIGDRIDVWTEGEFLIAYATPAVGDEGALLYIDVSGGSDNPSDLLPTAHASLSSSNDICVGQIVEFVSSTLGSWVKLKSRHTAVVAP